MKRQAQRIIYLVLLVVFVVGITGIVRQKLGEVEETEPYYSDAHAEELIQMNIMELRDYNTIIYGHRMKNRTMFGNLVYYNEEEYLEAHPYVYIVDDYG